MSAISGFGRTRPPKGFRRDPDTAELRCPHRNMSTCDACVAAYPEVVRTMGVEYWEPDPAMRAEMAGWDAKIAEADAERVQEEARPPRRTIAIALLVDVLDTDHVRRNEEHFTDDAVARMLTFVQHGGAVIRRYDVHSDPSVLFPDPSEVGA